MKEKGGINRSQQSELFNPHAARPITVIGAGSVGSQLVLQLARIGCTDITVYDGDHVESHNIPASAFEPNDLSMLKVVALAAHVRRQTGIEIKAIPRMYAGEKLRTTVVACVDTMEARMMIWERVKNNPLVDVFVDTRMAAELLAVYVIRPCKKEHVSHYDLRLYPTSEAMPNLCGRHGIVYGTAVAASIACRAVAASWSGEQIRPEVVITMSNITVTL